MSAIAIGTRCGERAVLPASARETHLHVLGVSGQGKSYFLEHMIRQDILSGNGVCVIDPHGELYENLLAWLAEHQIDRYRHIHLLNPSDDTWTVGFNPLCVGESDPTVRVGAMVSACLKVWGGADVTQTPRLAKCLRSVFYALAHHRLSLLEAKQLTSYITADVRERLTATLPNTAFREEWQEFNAYPQREFLNYFESTNSRLLPFIASPIISRMIGQTDTVIDFQRCMDERHIVLVNLATKDKYEEEDARLIGAMLFSDLFISAKRRQFETAKRTPFYCYIDECADYLTDDIARMLDQTRKFGLHLVLAHQRLEQLRRYGDNLYNAVMAGAQSKIVFKVDEDETADILARFLFRKELDLEEPKHILDKPVAVGQVPIWLHSESTTTARSETSSESHGEAETTVEASSTGEATRQGLAGEEAGSTETAGTSSGAGSVASSGWSQTISESSSTSVGRHQTLATEYQVMPTAVFSLEDQVHKAIVAVRSLPKRTAIAYVAEGGKPFRFSTIPIRPGAVLPSQIEHFVVRANRQSSFTTSAQAVEQQISERRQQTIEDVVIDDADEEFFVG